MQNPRFPRSPVVFLLLSVLFFLGLPSLVTAVESHASMAERRLLGLVDYINGDYSKAVQNGKIVSQTEFQELVNFAQTAQKLWAELKNRSTLSPNNEYHISNALSQLQDRLENRAQRPEIEALCYEVRGLLLSVFDLKIPPKVKPNWALAKQTYQDSCASCHGRSGHGDGVAAQGLDPAPRDFHDSDVMSRSSPFKFYNTLITGVDGTSMRSYASELTEEERWSLAFYLFSFQFNDPLQKASTAQKLDLKEVAAKLKSLSLNFHSLAYMTDQELGRWLKAEVSASPEWIQNALMLARVTLPQDGELPLVASPPTAQTKQDQIQHALTSAQGLVEKARIAISSTRYTEAEGLLLDAYLDHFEGVERSVSLLDPFLVKGVEQHFIAIRSYLQNNEAKLSLKEIEALVGLLKKASKLMSAEFARKNNENWSDFVSSFVIIVREGIEAFLVVAALLAVMGSLGFARGKRWIHLGWVSAVVAGFLTYFVFEWILHLSGESREVMESVLTGSAVIVLFYTGFWLLSQAERSKWDQFIKARTRQAMGSGKLWSLFGIAFIAVYREAAETVLFYSALLNTAQSAWHVGAGFLAGCVLLLGVCWGIVRLNMRLPLKQFFQVTSLLMMSLSVVLAGKSVHELMEAGLIQPTVLNFVPSVDFLGIYPSAETLLAQTLLVIAGLIGVSWMNHSKQMSGI